MSTMVFENELVRQRFYPLSVEAYHELSRLGRISEKTELIDGVIIVKMPKALPKWQFSLAEYL